MPRRLSCPHRQTCGTTHLHVRGGFTEVILTLAAGGRDQRSDDIALPELAEMFRRAAPRWPVPDEQMLDRCAFLHSITWVRRWSTPETQPQRAWQPMERDVRKALTTLASSLPPLIDTYRKLSGLPPFSQERVASLVILHRLIPIAQAALGPDFHRGTRSASWHAAASMIAAEAKDAWEQAGRTEFGRNPTSPLVRFTREFLSRAGIEQDHNTIAIALQRGIMGDQAKPPTTKKSDL
jgi:hypothetical protein